MKKMTSGGFEKMLMLGELRVPPLGIRVVSTEGTGGEDAILDVSWRGQSCLYAAELKGDAKPQTLQLAKAQAKQWAGRSQQAQPMVIAPYLSSEKLDELLDEGVSALDFLRQWGDRSPRLASSSTRQASPTVTATALPSCRRTEAMDR